ncbi:MAG TPA: cytochrome c3 family protein [Acidobacteriota bacterium]|nr:cytochrome c3 family protein [Acidobacteriota bacterium]
MGRKSFIVLLSAILVVHAVPADAGVKETKHNFTSQTYSPNAFFWGTKQVCVFCHTAHNGDQSLGQLWNHETNASQPYTMYQSATMDMTMSAAPHEGSLICLSCHDGTIAVNSLNNLPGPEGAGSYGTPGGAALDGSGRLTSASTSYVGTDLRDDHPVGVTYDASKDPDFVAKSGDPQQYPDRLLHQGLYVECTSCHNPHDNTYSDFLVESNAGSVLCLRCHTK